VSLLEHQLSRLLESSEILESFLQWHFPLSSSLSVSLLLHSTPNKTCDKFYRCSIVCFRCLIGKVPCVGILHSTDQVHPNRGLVLVVRMRPVHQNRTVQYDIVRPISQLLGRALRPAFYHIHKESVDKHLHLNTSNTWHQ
jgi:hypothetical protein